MPSRSPSPFPDNEEDGESHGFVRRQYSHYHHQRHHSEHQLPGGGGGGSVVAQRRRPLLQVPSSPPSPFWRPTTMATKNNTRPTFDDNHPTVWRTPATLIMNTASSSWPTTPEDDVVTASDKRRLLEIAPPHDHSTESSYSTDENNNNNGDPQNHEHCPSSTPSLPGPVPRNTAAAAVLTTSRTLFREDKNASSTHSITAMPPMPDCCTMERSYSMLDDPLQSRRGSTRSLRRKSTTNRHSQIEDTLQLAIATPKSSRLDTSSSSRRRRNSEQQQQQRFLSPLVVPTSSFGVVSSDEEEESTPPSSRSSSRYRRHQSRNTTTSSSRSSSSRSPHARHALPLFPRQLCGAWRKLLRTRNLVYLFCLVGLVSMMLTFITNHQMSFDMFGGATTTSTGLEIVNTMVPALSKRGSSSLTKAATGLRGQGLLRPHHNDAASHNGHDVSPDIVRKRHAVLPLPGGAAVAAAAPPLTSAVAALHRSNKEADPRASKEHSKGNAKRERHSHGPRHDDHHHHYRDHHEHDGNHQHSVHSNNDELPSKASEQALATNAYTGSTRIIAHQQARAEQIKRRGLPAVAMPASRALAVNKLAFAPHDRHLYITPELASTRTAKGRGKHQAKRVVIVDSSILKTPPLSQHRKIQQYPADFTDNTQLYSILDSSDERVKTMELREPYVQGECVPMQDWQVTFHPSCNGVHEVGLENMGGGAGIDDDFDLFGTKGYWRNAWRLDLHGGARNQRDTIVLKTLKINHRFEEAHFEHDRIDAVAMERLTSSPHVINVFGFCGHSVMTEYADGKRLGELADKSRKVPLARLKIARDIATGLADVHGIDGDGNATFVHLDVNPANVVSIGGTLKLNDFNIGIIRQWNTTSQTPCGFPAQYPNPQWRSPEEARNEQNLTEKVDVFSMGHIFFRLICGHEPWNKLEEGGKPSKEVVTDKVQRGVLPKMPDEVLHDDDPEIVAIRRAILACYTFDPVHRPSARSIAQGLQTALDALLAVHNETSSALNTTTIDLRRR